MSPRFLSQKMAQNDPKKNTPSTVANATSCLENLIFVVSHHVRANLNFSWMQGMLVIACRRCAFSKGHLTYVSIKREYVLLWMFSTAIWKP